MLHGGGAIMRDLRNNVRCLVLEVLCSIDFYKTKPIEAAAGGERGRYKIKSKKPHKTDEAADVDID